MQNTKGYVTPYWRPPSVKLRCSVPAGNQSV